MAEYIKKEKLFDCLDIKNALGGHYGISLTAINAIPAADVVEARSGVWTEKIVDDWTTQVNPFMRRRFYCSACGDWNTHGASKYCPNCGAKMDGGVNDAADN